MTPDDVLKALLALPPMEQVAVLAAYAKATGAMNISLTYEPDISPEQYPLEEAVITPHDDSFAFSDMIGNVSQHYGWLPGMKDTMWAFATGQENTGFLHDVEAE